MSEDPHHDHDTKLPDWLAEVDRDIGPAAERSKDSGEADRSEHAANGTGPEPASVNPAEDAPPGAASGRSRGRTADRAMGIGGPPPRRRHLFLGSESRRLPPHGHRVRVTLQCEGIRYIGEAEGPAVPGARAEIAARAALDALGKAEGRRLTLALRGGRVMRVFEEPVAVVGVYGMARGEANTLVGACLVRESEEEAAILATLQATDRWIAWEVSQPPESARP